MNVLMGCKTKGVSVFWGLREMMTVATAPVVADILEGLAPALSMVVWRKLWD